MDETCIVSVQLQRHEAIGLAVLAEDAAMGGLVMDDWWTRVDQRSIVACTSGWLFVTAAVRRLLRRTK